MSKHDETPTTPVPELLDLGSARRLTNSPDGGSIVEDALGNKFEPA